MRDCFDISDDDLARLAGVAKIEPEFMDAFKTAMREAAVSYFMAKNAPFVKKSVVKNRTEKLSKKAHRLVLALDEFEEALNDFPYELRHPALKLKDVRLYRNQRSLAEVQTCREIIKADAEAWADCTSSAYDAMGILKTGGGDNFFNWLLDILVNVYAAGERDVGISQVPDSSPVEFTGPLFKFINDCFDLFNEKKKEHGAMGSSITDACERWKARNPPDPPS